MVYCNFHGFHDVVFAQKAYDGVLVKVFLQIAFYLAGQVGVAVSVMKSVTSTRKRAASAMTGGMIR